MVKKKKLKVPEIEEDDEAIDIPEMQKEIRLLKQENQKLKEALGLFEEQQTLKNEEVFRYYIVNYLRSIVQSQLAQVEQGKERNELLASNDEEEEE